MTLLTTDLLFSQGHDSAYDYYSDYVASENQLLRGVLLCGLWLVRFWCFFMEVRLYLLLISSPCQTCIPGKWTLYFKNYHVSLVQQGLFSIVISEINYERGSLSNFFKASFFNLYIICLMLFFYSIYFIFDDCFRNNSCFRFSKWCVALSTFRTKSRRVKGKMSSFFKFPKTNKKPRTHRSVKLH